MPIGFEFQVNTHTADNQDDPLVVGLSDGGWVITWWSINQDGSGYGIYAQAYNADGTKQGVETQVNTYTTGNQQNHQITALTDGGWVITWWSINQDGSGYGIYAQAYNADGTKQGVETQVNTYTTGNQSDAQITALTDGGWVITWESSGQDGSSRGIYAQAYNADGTARGSEAQVNTYTTSGQDTAQITPLTDGGWVITWESGGEIGVNRGIYAQAYNADGSAQGGEFEITASTTDTLKKDATITGLADGGWVAAWESSGQEGDNFGIYAQAYNADGTKQGVETHVNTYTTLDQEAPQITALIDGGWVITWESNYQDGSFRGIYAQAYNADGTVRGGETQVNTYTTSAQEKPQITALSEGGWVITWESLLQDGSSRGIYAQAYNADGTKYGSEAQVNTYTTSTQEAPQITAVNDGGWVITWVSTGQDGAGQGIFAKSYVPLFDDNISVSLSGVQEVGEVLTADVAGVNLTYEALNVVYAWSVGSTVVATTLEPTFTLLAEHANQEVSVSVTFQDMFLIGDLVTKGAVSDLIFDGNDAPVGDVIFEVTDALDASLGDQDALESIEIGYTFSIDAFTIQDLDGTSGAAYQFQWLRSGEVIDGETGAQYTIAAEDEGHKIRLAISYTDDNGFDNTFLSETLKVAGLTGEFILGTESDEQLLGSSFNDVIAGLDGADTLVGFKGSDVLIGGKGDDVLSGNRGGDKLGGGNGSDTLLGGNGGDRLEGGKGDDVLTGGAGADRFVFRDGFGEDVITDFEAGVDELVFKNVVFGPGTSITSNNGDAMLTIGDNVLIVEDASLADVNYFGLPI